MLFLDGELRELSHVCGPTSLHDKKSNQPRTDGPLAIEPSSVVLQYAQTIFEGMKAYQDENGKVTLFRPDMNMERMNTSASRLALPVLMSFNAISPSLTHPWADIQRRCAPHPH